MRSLRRAWRILRHTRHLAYVPAEEASAMFRSVSHLVGACEPYIGDPAIRAAVAEVHDRTSLFIPASGMYGLVD